jgi:hypothetical protein
MIVEQDVPFLRSLKTGFGIEPDERRRLLVIADSLETLVTENAKMRRALQLARQYMQDIPLEVVEKNLDAAFNIANVALGDGS